MPWNLVSLPSTLPPSSPLSTPSDLSDRPWAITALLTIYNFSTPEFHLAPAHLSNSFIVLLLFRVSAVILKFLCFFARTILPTMDMPAHHFFWLHLACVVHSSLCLLISWPNTWQCPQCVPQLLYLLFLLMVARNTHLLFPYLYVRRLWAPKTGLASCLSLGPHQS